MPPLETIVFFALAGAAGGFINGFAGTGTALFALGFLLVVMPPLQAVAVIALVSVLAGLQGLWVVRHALVENRVRVLRFIIPGLIGVPIGVKLLQYTDADTLRLLVGGLLVAYGGYFSFRAALPNLSHPMPRTDIGVAFAGGILGGLASLSGALPAIWVSMRGWPKLVMRSVMQSFNVSILTLTVLTLMATGAFTPEAWTALAFVLPVGLVFAQIGIWFFKRINDEQFRRAQIILCLAMGLGIFIDALT